MRSPAITVYKSGKGARLTAHFYSSHVSHISNAMSLNDTTVLVFGGSRNIGYLSSIRLLGKISQPFLAVWVT